MTWLTPYLGAYVTAYEEVASKVTIGRMAKTLKLLESDYPPEEVCQRFQRYLAATPVRFYSVERFADTFPAWRKHEPLSSSRSERCEDLAILAMVRDQAQRCVT